ncbi:MAG: efflux RND transporter permease subunit [Flavobacteriales bacterium]|jgi:multidrug efflux pump|nr:efflux RND transporter permease subunit [Flavobacteriales bacterium]MBK6755133.1 efflux RND transporter permease subunit [Flavobacteriales bacterium]MBK7751312.1 efflux RND transporter permease subunit [Flavobacteriales bacterium]MBK9073659.1 efflux RND transporter permease subunit [Flavobacteriales bacterium]MBK9539358.1 efflux RND transporter permease subunit [Flavobacteriales bacterium]
MDHSNIENDAYGEGHGKQFAITSWAVKNRTTVMVITALIFIYGIYSYIAMPKESFPEVVTPEIYVATPYNSSSVVDIEKLITKPLEKEINTITGVDEINSTSVPNFSTIQVKFDYNVTPTEALRKVKDAVDKAQGDVNFPKDLPAEPNIFEMNFSEMIPVMNINLSGDYSIDQLHHYAKILEDRIEALPEINKVDIRGVPEKEVQVSVDVHKLEAVELNFGDVAMALQMENLTMSGGEVLTDGQRRAVRVIGEFADMDMIRDIVVKNEFQKEVRLRDIATVEFDYKEADSYAREYGKPVVMVDVIKRAGENLIIASDKINAILAETRGSVIPNDVIITITGDQSEDTRVQVDELFNHIIFGVILVVGTLLFFLGLRNALFVGLAIPMSMFISFIILNAFGVTLNIMVLFSLILALGRLVDDGIVIVENIYRHMSNGEPAMVATRKAVGEVTLPIVAATTATVMVFMPLLFWPGMMGQFMKWMPITFMVSLSASLFVALVVNPALSTQFMKVERENPNARKVWRLAGILAVVGTLIAVLGYSTGSGFITSIGTLSVLAGILGILNLKVAVPGTRWFQEVFLPRLETIYERFLRYALDRHHPRTFFFGTIGLLFFAVLLLVVVPPKVEFFPINEPKYVNVFIEAPIGTDIEKTDMITRRLESQVKRIVNAPPYTEVKETRLPDGTLRQDTVNWLINSMIAQVGSGTSDPAQGVSLATTPNKGRIQLNFVKYADRRGLKTNDVLLKLQKELTGYPGVIVSVDKDAAGPPTGKPINIEITGDEIEPLLAEADRLKRFMESKNVPGVEALRVDIDRAKPEMPIIIDRAKARRLNVSTYAVADAIRSALFGKEVSTYRVEGDDDDYKIMVRLQDDQRYDVGTIMDMKITFRDMLNGQIRQVPISAVATDELSSTFSAIKRTDLKRVVTVSSNVIAGYNANEVIAEMKEGLLGYEKDERFGMTFTGQQEDQEKEMAFLGKAFMIALFIVFLIIVWQFNSISWPMVILSTVLFSTIGVFLGLIIFRQDFIILMSMLGIISLIGVVVNNAIVLMDFAKLLFERKREKLGLEETAELPVLETREALIIAGKTRLRPVLLTAVTAVLGLLPLAVGFNLNFGTLFSELDPHIHIGGDNVIFWGPLSWAVIYGLIFATFLTLIMVPVMLLIIAKIKHRRAWKRSMRLAAQAEVAPTPRGNTLRPGPAMG